MTKKRRVSSKARQRRSFSDGVFGFIELVFFTSRKSRGRGPSRFRTSKEQREASSIRYWTNRDDIRRYWRDLPADRKASRNARSRAWRSKHGNRIRETNRAWQKKNKWRQSKYRRTPNQKLAQNIRRSYKARKLSGVRQLASATKLIGTTLTALAKHIEAQLPKGLSWDDYGSRWQLGHIRARSLFDLRTIKGQKAAEHYTNWQSVIIPGW